MCREARPTPRHCSLGAGRDSAGSWWGEGVLGEHVPGEPRISVCDGGGNAVKLPHAGRVSSHGCVGILSFSRMRSCEVIYAICVCFLGVGAFHTFVEDILFLSM